MEPIDDFEMCSSMPDNFYNGPDEYFDENGLRPEYKLKLSEVNRMWRIRENVASFLLINFSIGFGIYLGLCIHDHLTLVWH